MYHSAAMDVMRLRQLDPENEREVDITSEETKLQKLQKGLS